MPLSGINNKVKLKKYGSNNCYQHDITKHILTIAVTKVPSQNNNVILIVISPFN